MLRPFQEFTTPRHILDDTQEDEIDVFQEQTLQRGLGTSIKHNVNVECDILVVVPEILKEITQSLDLKDTYTAVKLNSYNYGFRPDRSDVEEEEFDEDEELYIPHGSQTIFSQDCKEFNMYQTTGPNNTRINFVRIPNYNHQIFYHNFVGLLEEYKLMGKKVICLGTSELNGTETVNRMIIGDFLETSLLKQVPRLKPPHYLSGAAAAVLLAASKKNLPAVGLVVAAEGAFHLGMERCSMDGIRDVSLVLDELLGCEGEYAKRVEKALVVKNSARSAGLYL